MEPQLRQALNKLRLADLKDLEISVLRTDAFLRPWTSFRDNFLLLQTKGMPLSALPGQVTRRDILYYYTFFYEGELRYDPQTDEDSKFYNADPRVHSVVDKRTWGVAEYERILYVSLLQAFKVGKKNNPYGFEYFECRNVCTAWEDVFVPIVETVRNDYNSKGRYHYGRLANAIEHASPSRVAFPEPRRSAEEVVKPKSKLWTPPVIIQLETAQEEDWVLHPTTGWLCRAQDVWVETEHELNNNYPQYVELMERRAKDAQADSEKEMRKKYPEYEELVKNQTGDEKGLKNLRSQYGAIVERPKLKMSFSNWFEEQRAIINHKRALRLLEGGPV